MREYTSFSEACSLVEIGDVVEVKVSDTGSLIKGVVHGKTCDRDGENKFYVSNNTDSGSDCVGVDVVAGYKYSWCINVRNFKKLTIDKKDTKTMSTLKEKFVLAITPEPKKSFRKAGITNGDDILTDEGIKIFLTWLLINKYADEFKTGVVDGLLTECKED